MMLISFSVSYCIISCDVNFFLTNLNMVQIYMVRQLPTSTGVEQMSLLEKVLVQYSLNLVVSLLDLNLPMPNSAFSVSLFLSC